MFHVNVDQFLNRTKGNFSMKFPNGYTVSLAMGDGMYCSGNQTQGFSSVEVAAWDADGNWVKLGDNDDIVGWQSTDDVLAIMNRVAAM